LIKHGTNESSGSSECIGRFILPSLPIGAMVVDGAAMLAAAVRAAVLAKAPRRTVQAVAAAVAGVFARPDATQRPAASVPAGSHCAAKETGHDASAEELLAALRSARNAQRRKKKERRREAKMAASKAAEDVNVFEKVPTEQSLGGGLPALVVLSAQKRSSTTGAVECQDPFAEDEDLSHTDKKLRCGGSTTRDCEMHIQSDDVPDDDLEIEEQARISDILKIFAHWHGEEDWPWRPLPKGCVRLWFPHDGKRR
jgi:hypothetical protein